MKDLIQQDEPFTIKECKFVLEDLEIQYQFSAFLIARLHLSLQHQIELKGK